MDNLAYNQIKFAAVIDNINKELHAKGEGTNYGLGGYLSHVVRKSVFRVSDKA